MRGYGAYIEKRIRSLSDLVTISDSKRDFHKAFPYVIPPIYRKLADELLVELHLLSHQKNFKSSPIFATGLKEIFNKFTSGYKPTEHINELFNAICNCNGFNPSEINTLDEQIISEASKINKELGWKPSLQFQEGLGLTIDWYMSNQNWLDNVTSGDYKNYYKKQYS